MGVTETTMVQDQDLHKLIGQMRDQSPGAGVVRRTGADMSTIYNPVDISGTNQFLAARMQEPLHL